MTQQIKRRKDVNPKRGEHEYGDVKFADPVNKKYPIDTTEHVARRGVTLTTRTTRQSMTKLKSRPSKGASSERQRRMASRSTRTDGSVESRERGAF